MSSRIFSFFRKSETHRVWRCSFFCPSCSPYNRWDFSGTAAQVEPEFGIHQIWYLFHNLGRYEYIMAGKFESLLLAWRVFSLANAKWLGWIEARAELAEEEQEKGRWWNRVVSFFPSCNKGPVDKRVWKRHPLSLSRNNFGGSGKGRPFVLHFAKRTFSLCSLCSWQKKGGKFALPFPKKTRIVQTRLNDTAWRID